MSMHIWSLLLLSSACLLPEIQARTLRTHPTVEVETQTLTDSSTNSGKKTKKQTVASGAWPLHHGHGNSNEVVMNHDQFCSYYNWPSNTNYIQPVTGIEPAAEWWISPCSPVSPPRWWQPCNAGYVMQRPQTGERWLACEYSYNEVTSNWTIVGNGQTQVAHATFGVSGFIGPGAKREINITITCGLRYVPLVIGPRGNATKSAVIPPGENYTMWTISAPLEVYCNNQLTPVPGPPTPVPTLTPQPTATTTPQPTGTSTPSPGGSADCAQYATCKECVTSPSGTCGFCSYSRSCEGGTVSGPRQGTCPSGYWEWFLAEC